MVEKAIIPIYMNDGIEATAFFTQWKGKQFLVTAGHTFENVQNCEGFYFYHENERYELSKLTNQLKYIELPENNSEYLDYAIFQINFDVTYNLTLVKCIGEIDNIYKCYGYNPSTKKLEIEDRIRIDFTRTTSVKGRLNIQNCKTGFGKCVAGYSGGPILISDTNEVIGMTVVGDNTPGNILNKRQHFIISDFLIKILEEFQFRII